MASFSDQVKVLIDVDSTGATSGITKFKSSFAEAEGAVGKFKVASGAAFDFVQKNAAQFAAIAGAAIGTFAIKAITEFQDLSLEVDKFKNSTGLSADAASRWIEVSGDLGVSADTVKNAINKMNREIAGNRDEFEKLGIEIAKTDTGATDVNKTFLNVIDRLQKIGDPAKRAQVATQLLGKSWQEVSEIITMGAGAVTQALSEVGGAKIIDENDIERAKQLRAAQDALKDAFEEFTLTVGEKLVPALVQAVEAALPLLKALEPLADATLGAADSTASYGEQISKSNIQIRIASKAAEILGNLFGTNKEKTDETNASTKILNETWAKSAMAASELRYRGQDLARTISVLDENTNGLTDTWDEFLGQIDSERAWENLKKQVAEYEKAVLIAFKKNTPEAWAAADEARRVASEGVADYIQKLGDVPLTKQTEILAMVKNQDFDLAIKTLGRIPKQIIVDIVGKVRGVPIPRGQTPSETSGRGTRSTMDFKGISVLPDNAGEAVNALDKDTNGLIDSWDSLLERLDRNEAWDNIGDQIAEYRRDLLDAFKKKTPDAARTAIESSRDVIRAFADIAQQAKLTNEQQIALKALMDKGDFDRAYLELEKMLAQIPKEVVISVKAKDETKTDDGTTTPTPAPIPTGPIQIRVPGEGQITLNRPTLNSGALSAQSLSGNVTINVAGSVISQNDLVEQMRIGLINAQKSGKQLVYSNT